MFVEHGLVSLVPSPPSPGPMPLFSSFVLQQVVTNFVTRLRVWGKLWSMGILSVSLMVDAVKDICTPENFVQNPFKWASQEIVF